ncbi:hypothetical protein U1Q18_004570 [Sarracenia purpurea var. burkii]
MLQQKLSKFGQEGSTQELIRIFTSEELKQATNNYDKTRILNWGGNDAFYHGILSDHQTVAVKKPNNSVDENQTEQFINEIPILSQIIHRNVVKLLYWNGVSRLILVDQNQLATMVQGTLGYLDPEYLQTSQLTEKSDVYSFEMVLVELKSGKKVFYGDQPEKERYLANFFLSCMRNDRLNEIIDELIVIEGNVEEQIRKVTNLAKRCLRVRGEERLSMREVAMELEGLIMKNNMKNKSDSSDDEESVRHLGET